MLRTGSLAYGPARVSRETGVRCDGSPRRTIQSAKDETDINVIVKRFGVSGQAPGASRMPAYGDFTGVSDFRTAQEYVRAAQESFNALPSHVRLQFGNDPHSFMVFSSDPKNIDELRRMGLAKKLDPVIIPPADVPPKGDEDEGDSGKRAGKAAKASKGSNRSSDGE